MPAVKPFLVVRPAVWVLLAFALVIMPAGWIVAWLLAVCTHELGHILACKFCKVHVHRIEVDFRGARIHTEGMSSSKQIICSFAGPICGCCLMLLLKLYSKVALCALIQTIFNLLPVQGTDGGCILHTSMLVLLGDEKGNRVFSIIEKLTRVLLLLLLLYFTIKWSFGAFVFILSLWRLRRGDIKIPCKRRALRVQ